MTRPANIDGVAGATEEVARIVLRADSGFCRDALMAWCDGNGGHYLFGLAKNARLLACIKEEHAAAKAEHEQTGPPARRFRGFMSRTRDSWSCRRRVVGKTKHLRKGAHPRFAVTTLTAEEFDARALYEDPGSISIACIGTECAG